MCIHGRWEDGVCICHKGYENNDSTNANQVLSPVYCAKEVVIIISQPGILGDERILHFIAMAVSLKNTDRCLYSDQY